MEGSSYWNLEKKRQSGFLDGAEILDGWIQVGTKWVERINISSESTSLLWSDIPQPDIRRQVHWCGSLRSAETSGSREQGGGEGRLDLGGIVHFSTTLCIHSCPSPRSILFKANTCHIILLCKSLQTLPITLSNKVQTPYNALGGSSSLEMSNSPASSLTILCILATQIFQFWTILMLFPLQVYSFLSSRPQHRSSHLAHSYSSDLSLNHFLGQSPWLIYMIHVFSV